jgi:prevent-host-death family protein
MKGNLIQHVAAPDFKANCLRLLDEVAQRRRPIIVTKRGKPVAKLVP